MMPSTQVIAEPAYIPGVCNINRAEINSRRKAGRLGIVLYVVFLVALLFITASRWFRLALFIPAFLAAVGYLQAKNKFCVGYASAGLQNATNGNKTAQKITDTSALSEDEVKTRKINLQSAGMALVATVFAVILPHL